MSKIAHCAIIFVQALAVWMPTIITITIMRITIMATIVMTTIMIMATIIIITLIHIQTTRLGRNPCVIAT